MINTTHRQVPPFAPALPQAIEWWGHLYLAGWKGMVVEPLAESGLAGSDHWRSVSLLEKSRRSNGSCTASHYVAYACVFGVLAMESEPVNPRL